MLKKNILSILILVSGLSSYSQVCQVGALFVTGSGCGCLSGCNLTSIGGPNCSPSVSGNCSGGYLPMSTTITVPAGCGVTIVAEMKTRSGCSASGADGNSTSKDRLRIRNTAGPTPAWKIGGSNSSLSDNMTIVGPATVVIEGAANRKDEIISYSIAYSSGACTCSQILPITLLNFSGEQIDDNNNVLRWSTSSEINNDYFTLERSPDANHFEEITTIAGAGNSNTILHYNHIDYISNKNNTNYYRLKQTDYDGNFTYSNTIVLSNNFSDNIYYDNILKQLKIGDLKNKTINIYNLQGQNIKTINTSNKSILLNLAKGMYLVSIQSGNQMLSKKIIVQ